MTPLDCQYDSLVLSIDEAYSSSPFIPLPSAQRPKPVSNPDLLEYNCSIGYVIYYVLRGSRFNIG